MFAPPTLLLWCTYRARQSSSNNMAEKVTKNKKFKMSHFLRAISLCLPRPLCRCCAVQSSLPQAHQRLFIWIQIVLSTLTSICLCTLWCNISFLMLFVSAAAMARGGYHQSPRKKSVVCFHDIFENNSGIQHKFM